MDDGAVASRADGLGVAPQRARGEIGRTRLPFLAPRRQLAFAQVDRKLALHGIDDDRIAVLQQRDRTADGGLGADMADAESALT